MVQVPSQKDWTDYLPALTAFAAVIIGPAIQLLISRRQNITTVKTTALQISNAQESISRQISANAAVSLREKRIDDLRDLAANYLDVLGQLSALMFGSEGHLTIGQQGVVMKFSRDLFSLQLRIEVLLDESEEHKKLFILMQEFYIIARETVSESAAHQFDTKRQEFVSHLRKVIDNEYAFLQRGK